MTIVLFFLTPQKTGTVAEVQYQGKVILTIDLTKDQEYEVTGTNGKVKLLVQDQKIKVVEENSPKHLCSKQGFISKAQQTIVCLPNEIVITIIGPSNLDTIVR